MLAQAGFADSERSSCVHNNLGTLHERLAGAPDAGDPDWNATSMPNEFSPEAEAHFNLSLRHLFISLRWNQKHRGELNYHTACVHQTIASVCFWARVWEGQFRHHQAARIGMHACLGPEHPMSVRADNWCQSAMENAPASRAAELEPGLEKELIELARCRACWHCHKQEDTACTFQFCGRCLVTRYCSRECQKSDWKNHRHACRRLAKVGAAVKIDKKRVKEHGLRRSQMTIQRDMILFGKATLAELFKLKADVIADRLVDVVALLQPDVDKDVDRAPVKPVDAVECASCHQNM